MLFNRETVLIGVLSTASVAGALVWQDEKELAFESLPVAVQDTAVEFLGRTDLKAEASIRDGARVYEVETDRRGREFSLLATADGDLIEKRHPVDLQDLPEAVRGVLAHHYPGREFSESVRVESFSYRFEFERDGVEHVVTVYPTGRLVVVDEPADKD